MGPFQSPLPRSEYTSRSNSLVGVALPKEIVTITDDVSHVLRIETNGEAAALGSTEGALGVFRTAISSLQLVAQIVDDLPIG
jgi:hypothetical protein